MIGENASGQEAALRPRQPPGLCSPIARRKRRKKEQQVWFTEGFAGNLPPPHGAAPIVPAVAQQRGSADRPANAYSILFLRLLARAQSAGSRPAPRNFGLQLPLLRAGQTGLASRTSSSSKGHGARGRDACRNSATRSLGTPGGPPPVRPASTARNSASNARSSFFADRPFAAFGDRNSSGPGLQQQIDLLIPQQLFAFSRHRQGWLNASTAATSCPSGCRSFPYPVIILNFVPTTLFSTVSSAVMPSTRNSSTPLRAVCHAAEHCCRSIDAIQLNLAGSAAGQRPKDVIEMNDLNRDDGAPSFGTTL